MAIKKVKAKVKKNPSARLRARKAVKKTKKVLVIKKKAVRRIITKKKKVKKILKIKKPASKKPHKKTKAKHKKIVLAKKPKAKKKIIAKKPRKAKKVVKHKKPVAVKKIIKHKALRRGSGRAKKHHQKTPIAEFPAESFFKAKIKVIGIGGGGGSIVSEIGRSLEKATFVVADTDIRALKKKSGIKYLWFGQELTHGLGTGVNVDLAKQAAESAKEKISGIFKDQDIIIFIASLGGGLGSGATQVFAEAARDFGGITFGIFTMPFKFEGKNKYRIAQNALKSLRQTLNVSLVIPNEKIFKIIDANTAITDAFSTVNRSLIESLESLIDLIYNPGIINIDFADLRTILKGRGNTAFLNTTEESGKNRAEKVCENVLVNPLLQNSNFDAEKILFNIAGSENLSMFEVEKISSHIANLNPKAKIIFGISKNAKLKNKIKTTILMTGGQIKEEAVIEKPEPVKAIAPLAIKEPAKKIIDVKKEIKIKTKKAKVKKKIKSEKKPKENKPAKSGKKQKKAVKKEQKPVSFIPIFENNASSVPVIDQARLSIAEVGPVPTKKTIRRSGLEIKKAEEQEERKRMDQEKEWEIPAFLRRVKYNK
jgi:cell division protein FtsZ